MRGQDYEAVILPQNAGPFRAWQEAVRDAPHPSVAQAVPAGGMTALDSALPLPSLGAIPAGAGSSRSARTHPGNPRGHPRVCEEHTICRSGCVVVPGPSLQVQATPEKGVCVGEADGTIPARTGSTS